MNTRGSFALALACCGSLLLGASAALPPGIAGLRSVGEANCTGRRVTITSLGTSAPLPVRDYVSALQLVTPSVADHLRVAYNASDAEIQAFRSQLLTTTFPNLLNISVDPQVLAASGAVGGDAIIPVNVSVQGGLIHIGLYTPPAAVAALLGTGPLTAASLSTIPPEFLASPLAPNAIINPWSRNTSVAPLYATITGFPSIDPTAPFSVTEGGFALTLLRPLNISGATLMEYSEQVLPAYAIWLWGLAQIAEATPPAGQQPRKFQINFITPVPKLPGLRSITEVWDWNTASPPGIAPLGAAQTTGLSILQPRANGVVVYEQYVIDLTGPPLVDCPTRLAGPAAAASG